LAKLQSLRLSQGCDLLSFADCGRHGDRPSRNEPRTESCNRGRPHERTM